MKPCQEAPLAVIMAGEEAADRGDPVGVEGGCREPGGVLGIDLTNRLLAPLDRRWGDAELVDTEPHQQRGGALVRGELRGELRTGVLLLTDVVVVHHVPRPGGARQMPAALRAELNAIRADGIATEVEEAVLGKCGIAAPLVGALAAPQASA